MDKREIIKDIKNNSYLNLWEIQESNLIDDCVLQVESLLEIKPPIIIFGKQCQQPRDIGFFCNTYGVEGYKYSTQIMKSKPLPPALEMLINKINTEIGSNYNAVLVNRYCDGNNSIGKHSDDETHLDPNVGVLMISWGQTRKFRIRKKGSKGFIDIPCGHMTCIHMGGDFQKYYTHEIPVEKKVKGLRYSFTFRHHKPTI